MRHAKKLSKSREAILETRVMYRHVMPLAFSRPNAHAMPCRDTTRQSQC